MTMSSQQHCMCFIDGHTCAARMLARHTCWTTARICRASDTSSQLSCMHGQLYAAAVAVSAAIERVYTLKLQLQKRSASARLLLGDTCQQ
jgi:hypothetical protein